MKKTFLRWIACLLVLLTVAALAACTDPNKGPVGSTPMGEQTDGDETADPFDALPDRDLKGYAFNVLIRNEDYIVKDMFQETVSQDNVESAIYNRNLKVEEAFKVDLVPIAKAEGFTAMDSIFAGDAEYDLILPHARYAAMYAGGGYLLDWHSLPVVDLTAEWWDQNCNESLSIHNRLFYTTGDISYWSYGATNQLLFNKNLFTEIGLEYPYQDVKDNDWTIDDFEVLVKKGSKDLDGDGKFDYATDQFGYMTIGFVGDVQAYHATGNTVISKDIDDTPYISYLTDRAEDVWEWYSTLIEDDSVYFQDRLVSYFDTNAVKGFQSGRSLFIDINTINVAAMREMEDEFGIIPWPTYAEGETYLTNVDAGMHLFCLPITTPDAERTGLVLEALAILGHQTVIPEYMETTVKYKQTRDDESFEMLDIIFDGRVYDLGYYNVELTGAVGKDEAIANNFKHLTENDVASMAVAWAKYQTSAEQYLEDYLIKLEQAVS